jgi:hypothetical protein
MDRSEYLSYSTARTMHTARTELEFEKRSKDTTTIFVTLGQLESLQTFRTYGPVHPTHQKKPRYTVVYEPQSQAVC